MKKKSSVAMTVVCIILGIIISWQYQSMSRNNEKIRDEKKTVEDIKAELLNEKHNNEELRGRLEELQKQNEAYLSASGNYSQTLAQVEKEINRAKIIAGLTDVQGKGVVITLDDYLPATVLDTNILAVLNELKASGAQAICINEERVVATTEVRVAGDYMMVNGKQMRAPFVIKAIADPENVEHSFNILGGVKEELELMYQIKVTLEKKDNVFIPKVRDDGTVIKTSLLQPVKESSK